MTNQEAFDKMVTHLASMTEPCKEDGTCIYLNSEGQRCAVGALLTQEEAEFFSAEEDLSASGIFHHSRKTSIDHLNIEMLGDVQYVHDSSYNWKRGNGLNESGLDKLRVIANIYKLDTAVLEKVRG